MIDIEEGKIKFHINPIKLATNISKNSDQNWFGDVVADNFKKV